MTDPAPTLTPAQQSEQFAAGAAALCGKLSAVLAWVVDHDGECLCNHPQQRARAQQVMAEARDYFAKGSRHDF